MEAQKRIDKVLTAAQKKAEGEVGALLGVPFTLTGSLFQPVSKEQFFENLSGKQILARMDITGEISGLGCLVVSLKDAIRLGGTLIMLPPSEMEEVVSREEYNEDTEDSFGEIANIIAGSYTKVFEEMFPQNCRFIRKEQETILPIKVDVGSDQPVPDQIYYQISATMSLGEKQMGDMFMLLPAETFGLKWESTPAEGEVSVAAKAKPAAAGWPEEKAQEEAVAAPAAVTEEPADVREEAAPAVLQDAAGETGGDVEKPASPPLDYEKHRKLVDRLLDACREKMEEEVGALLGCDVKIHHVENRLILKEDFFFEEVTGKQVMATMDVVGDLEGSGYFFIGLKDAIHVGGTLIMLPQSELESVIADEEFGDDTQDAYGEIANIIAGAYSNIFEDEYIKHIRFVKTGIETIVPMKVAVESDRPFANQQYYMHSMSLVVSGKKLGGARLLLPSGLLQLDKKDAPLAQEEPKAAVEVKPRPAEKPFEAAAPESAAAAAGPYDILLIGDDDIEAARLDGVLAEMGYRVCRLGYKDNIHKYLSRELKAVYLVMREVSEQGFGIAIKVNASCRVPLIAAGPGWTKSKVFKAVKYGVSDILLTPASREDIEENVRNNMIRMAA
jgi:chemotaxis protein CheY-P-specific phosphatase CheC